MNSPIKTNQLEANINREALAEQYDIFKVSTTKQWFDHGSYILDAPQLCNEVCSVFFEYGNCFYVLMRKSSSNRSRLLEVLRKEKDGDTISLEEANPYTIYERVVVSLLLRDMGSYQNEQLRFNNLTGHLYCSCTAWMKTGKYKGVSYIKQVPCLELSIDRDMCLIMNMRTFTSELERRNIVFDKTPFEKYPRFVFGARQTLRRRLKDEKEPGYILRQMKGEWTTITFLDIHSEDEFKATKMGVLYDVIQRFNRKYQGVCRLSFHSITEYSSVEDKSADIRKKIEIKANAAMLKTRPIKIVDYIGDEQSAVFSGSVQAAVQRMYGIEVPIGKRLSRKYLNLCVIHHAEYYNGKKDPHQIPHEGFAVQHITLEDFKENQAGEVGTVIKNLLIKEDIKNGCLSLFDWSNTGFDSSIRFGLCEREKDSERYFFMDIQPDGSFSFCEKTMDPSTNDSYTDCINAMAGKKQKDVAGVIQYADGCINVLRETPLFTIPELEQIKAELAVGNTDLRGVKAKNGLNDPRHELLSAVTDIRMFEQKGRIYYFVGVIGSGMQSRVQHAAHIRRVEPFGASDLRFEAMLPLMNVTFVRDGRLTVLPFPFKYLREYVASL